MSQSNKNQTPKAKQHEQMVTLTGQALLDDMAKHRRKVTKSKAAARQFLKDLGVLTADGKTRNLIRG